MENKQPVGKVVMAALMMCLIILSTLILRLPIPFTQGYVHLGDATVFLAVLLLGAKYGAVAAAVGSALADTIGGFVIWAPWTLGIKGGMAVILAVFAASAMKNAAKSVAGVSVKVLAGMILAGVWMVAGYYVAEGCIYGNWIVPVIGVPWNIGQFAIGMILAVILATALLRTPAQKYFTYRLS